MEQVGQNDAAETGTCPNQHVAAGDRMGKRSWVHAVLNRRDAGFSIPIVSIEANPKQIVRNDRNLGGVDTARRQSSSSGMERLLLLRPFHPPSILPRKLVLDRRPPHVSIEATPGDRIG